MTLKAYSGNAAPTYLVGTLGAGVGAGGTITVVDGSNYPAGPTPFVVTLNAGGSTEEKILCNLRSGNVLTIQQRGYDSTTAVAHNNGELVTHGWDANSASEASAHANDDGTHDYHIGYVLRSLLTNRGDLFVRGASVIARLGLGAANTVFRSNGTDPVWGQIVGDDIANDTITAAQIAPGGVGLSELAAIPACKATTAVFSSPEDSVSSAALQYPALTEVFDTTGMHDDVTNPSRITIAATGKYRLVARFGVPNAGVAGGAILTIRKNHTTDVETTDKVLDGTFPTGASTQQFAFSYLEITTMAALTAGDYIEVGTRRFAASTSAMAGCYVSLEAEYVGA